MNNLSLNNLKEIISVQETYNLTPNEIFDFFYIVSLPKNKYKKKVKNPLFFITYARDEESNDAWYIGKLDLRPKMNKIMKSHPNYTFVIDKTMISNVDTKKYKLILVNDINESIDSLFNYYKSKSQAKTIAITGSVGKTTCVGLIEAVLKPKYKVMRIYSKRITPLILKAYIINFIKDDIDYIVLENSIFFHDHVEILTDIMKPEIGVILNIESSHLGIEKLKTIDDICKYKSKIMKYAKYGYIFSEDPYLDKLYLENNDLKYDDEIIVTNPKLQLERIDINRISVENLMFNIDSKFTINPFILTPLAQKQCLVSYLIGKQLGLTDNQIKQSMENYEVVENRIKIEKAFGKKIIFDGDITTFERFKELSDNMYKNSVLVLRKVGSAENTLRIAKIKELFHKYKKVYIFDDVEYLEKLKNKPNVEIVHDHSFMKDIENTIIYHYSGYYRVWDKFDMENLKIYDKEKYPIKTNF